ncbi:MAG: serine/threonine protein kinase/Flp pilus assembly protein TadD [Planctomycetota bacterium]|jgi:serine/threonine protein kinase/Flp pilus assembly protein TadD
MSNPNAPTIERIVLAFQQAYFEDDSKDGAKSLSHYLKLWPDHEDLIAKEFLNLQDGIVESVEMHDLDADSKTLGPYALDREIGRGGQGVVYKATDSRLGRVVALKVLTGLGPGAEKQIIRFRREAEVAARLDHPGICGVHDAGVEDGVPYIAMRYVSGESLAQRLSRSKATSNGDNGESIGFLDLTEMGTEGDGEEIQPQGESPTDVSMTKSQLDATLRVFEKAARALHAAHGAGVIHRDVKPGNIMVTDEGEPVVLDFGLAHDDSEDMPSLTQTGDFFGTPAYMSPEQIAGQRIHLDARSDVYSLGVTLFESLVLRRPFDAPTREGLYQAIMTKEAPDPRRLNSAISKDLKVVLECVLEKDRDKRYQSALAFADDLAAVRELRPIAANPIGPVGRMIRWAKRKPVRATFAAALIIGIPLITGLAGYIFANLPNIEAQEQAVLDEKNEKALERGFFELYVGDKKKAPAHFERVLERKPDSIGAAAGLAESYMKLKEPESALRVLEKVEKELADPAILYSLKADVLDKLDRKADAKSTRELAKPPSSAITWFLEGLRIWNNGKTKGERWPVKEIRLQAAANMRRAVRSSPTARRVYHIMLAVTIRHDAGREVCIGLAQAMERLWPRDFEIYFWSAMCTEFTAPDKSAIAFQSAAKIRPDSWPAYGNAGIMLETSGRLKDAIPLFRKAIELGSTYAVHYLSLAASLNVEGKLEEAAAICRQGLQLPDSPEVPWFHIELSYILRNQGKKIEAAEQIKEAELYCRTQAKLVDDQIQKGVLYSTLGTILIDDDRLGEAIQAFEYSIRLDPTEVDHHNDLGCCYLANGQHDLAESSFRKAILHDPHDPHVNLNLGYILHLRGQNEKANRLFTESLKSNPGMILLKNQRCRSWAKGLKPRNRYTNFWAKRQALYAVRMTHGKDAASLDLLATIEFMQDKLDDAVKHQNQLLTLMNDEDVGDLKIADAQANLAKYKKAMNGEGSK